MYTPKKKFDNFFWMKIKKRGQEQRQLDAEALLSFEIEHARKALQRATDARYSIYIYTCIHASYVYIYCIYLCLCTYMILIAHARKALQRATGARYCIHVRIYV